MEIIFLCNSDKSAIYAICVLRWRVHTSLWLITVGAIPCSHHARGLQIFIALLRALRFYLPRLLISKRFRSKIEDIIVEEKKRGRICARKLNVSDYFDGPWYHIAIFICSWCLNAVRFIFRRIYNYTRSGRKWNPILFHCLGNYCCVTL